MDTELFVGDIVEFSPDGISVLCPRTNLCTRPYVANLDALIIVLSVLPSPDYVLVDKLLILCAQQKITPILCVNKKDISTNAFLKKVERDYKHFNIFIVSAKSGKNLKKLKKAIKNKFVGFCGQSAVGKTSILNALNKGFNLEIGDLSRKTERGKHTTRTTEIFKLFKNTYICDTPGFTKISLSDIDPEVLKDFYPEFSEVENGCKFSMCLHINEPNCKVQKLVESGKLSEDRYYRYLDIHDEVTREWKNRYGKR